MDGTEFYRPVTSELCQGDVFERVPLVFIKDNPSLLNKTTLSRGRGGYEIGDQLSAALPALTQPVLVAASCDYTRAMLLPYDCEIDKQTTKVLSVVLVRPLNPLSDSDKTIIRENRKFAFYYLPPHGPGQEEGYLDFRRIGTVGADLARASKRISRLSDAARKGMLFQLYRYLTRIDLHKAMLPPPEEEGAGQ